MLVCVNSTTGDTTAAGGDDGDIRRLRFGWLFVFNFFVLVGGDVLALLLLAPCAAAGGIDEIVLLGGGVLALLLLLLARCVAAGGIDDLAPGRATNDGVLPLVLLAATSTHVRGRVEAAAGASPRTTCSKEKWFGDRTNKRFT